MVYGFCRGLGVYGLGYRGLGYRGLGCTGLGCRGSGCRVLGYRVGDPANIKPPEACFRSVAFPARCWNIPTYYLTWASEP